MADDLQKLLDTLRTGNILQRRQAAYKLGQMQNPALVPDLIAAAKDEDRTLRAFIAGSLASVGAPAVPRLVAALDDDVWTVRQTAVLALRHIADAQTVAPIIALAEADPHEAVRGSAVNALEGIGTPEALAAVARLRAANE